MTDKVELLAPAGDFETALTAFEAGADAVYCGLSDFSARAFAVNFSLDDLKKLVRYARARGGKVYLTFNTVLDESAIEDAVRELAEIEAVGVDGLIVQDLGVARLCRKYFPDIVLHASTQLVAHNLEGVLALKDLGFRRVVLARELSAEEIASIVRRSGDMEFEAFIHGALCYSVSGLCLYSAMEKDRSGNRGKCAYCCRQCSDGRYPFSMKDLRLGEDVRKLVNAGVVSLKIEGRMKSAVYVGSVVKYYRQILDADRDNKPTTTRITPQDLETVFSRRTTTLYVNGKPAESVIDSESLGHLGTPIGTVKKVTRDREGARYVRFHTARALEKHDGLQFSRCDENGRHLGLGISLMRPAISRTPVFEVAAGTDVEILIPDEMDLRSGDTVYCSMSNAVKRAFPAPKYRPSDYPGMKKIDVEVVIAPDAITANGVAVKGEFAPAQHPEKTFGAVEKAFSKLGETDFALGKLTVEDPDRLFAPMSVLNDLRRDLVEKLENDAAKEVWRRKESALNDDATGSADPGKGRFVKLRAGQTLPDGDWTAVIVAINADTPLEALPQTESPIRLSLPVYTPELRFNRLRSAVKRFIRAGYTAWEATDLATLRMLKACGVIDIWADWTCYAFNASALRQWSELGVRHFTASPENDRENLQFLFESGYEIDFLEQQSTPLFISLTEPAARPEGLDIFMRDGLWITTKPVPRVFKTPEGAATRIDLSWSKE